MSFDASQLTYIVPIAAFGAVAAIAWLVLDAFSRKSSRAEERLDEFRDPLLRKQREAQANKPSSKAAVAELLSKATPALAKPLQPKSEEELDRLRLRLTQAGFRSESAPTFFLSLKFAFLVVGFFVSGGTVALLQRVAGGSVFEMSALMKIAFVSLLAFFIPELLLKLLSSRRKKAIFLGLPDALDLLVVCVEAGLGLDQAMRRVSEEMKRSYPVIAEEFGLCNLQLQMGKSRKEVLEALGQRTGVEDLRSLASILIQADKFGSSIAQALRVQSDSMRTRRQQIAEEKAAKTAVKLIFPLVIFIFPAIFVVLVGPAAITMVREMFPAMQGGG